MERKTVEKAKKKSIQADSKKKRINTRLEEETSVSAVKINYKSTIDSIRKDMVGQLTGKNMATAMNLSLVEDYLENWCGKQSCILDIAKRGVNVIYTSSTGFANSKANESIKSLATYTANMLKIYMNLGLREPTAVGDDAEAYI